MNNVEKNKKSVKEHFQHFHSLSDSSNVILWLKYKSGKRPVTMAETL